MPSQVKHNTDELGLIKFSVRGPWPTGRGLAAASCLRDVPGFGLTCVGFQVSVTVPSTEYFNLIPPSHVTRTL